MLDEENQTDVILTTFYVRIARVRTLREHHLWGFAHLLFADLSHAPTGTRRRLESLVASDAMLDAVMLLATLATPPRYVSRIYNEDGIWACTVQVEARPRGISQSTHQDLAAAILGSLILSCLHMPIGPLGQPEHIIPRSQEEKT